MCGITGFIDAQNTSTEVILEKMTHTMVHRGPDGGNHIFYTLTDFSIGLGHRRLSIIDLSEGGTQPMRWEEFWICFNGEIYNYREIKKELITLGHSFVSSSDTEVILHAYQQWGEACLNKFRGMFAFVIIDNKKKDVFCVRDRVGVKPFYYYFKDGLFLFASELKAFYSHPTFQKRIQKASVELYLQFGNIPAPYTIFEDTFKLQPGHLIHFSFDELKKNSTDLEQRQYWSVYDAYNQPKLDISFSEALLRTEELMKESFQLRMVSDVPVGVFLSGGFDSVAVASILQKAEQRTLKTFTIAVPDSGLNEAPYAKTIANYLGTEHTEMECSHQEAIGLIDDLPYYYDEPYGDSSAIPTSLVAKVARQHVTVALSADGGDELFAGYNRYDYLLEYGKLLNRTPKVLRKLMSVAMEQMEAEKIPFLKNKYNFANRYEKLKYLLKDPSPEQMMWSLSSQFNELEMNRLVLQRENSLKTAYQSTELEKTYYSVLSYMQAIDFQTYLPDDIMTKVDRATMRFSLEGREPFLDHKLVEWAAQLPDNFKYNNGIKKYILRQIVYKHIPKELMDRPKMGFAIPIEKWMREDWRSRIDDYLSTDRIKTQGIFNPEEVERLKIRFMNGKSEYGVKIWYLLMFQMWWERWMY
ncbi:MAG: asparagine synthase (glutamine-hydrolyzing) [Brumimicrobium sp.]|nr:asparagine synthase (glutamine-hydrolyzing) [Brumimicrobium sp.]